MQKFELPEGWSKQTAKKKQSRLSMGGSSPTVSYINDQGVKVSKTNLVKQFWSAWDVMDK